MKKKFVVQGKYVAECRKKHTALSQQQVARAIGIKTGQYVSNTERGLAGVPLKVAKKWCEIVGANPQQLKQAILSDKIIQIDEALGL